MPAVDVLGVGGTFDFSNVPADVRHDRDRRDAVVNLMLETGIDSITPDTLPDLVGRYMILREHDHRTGEYLSGAARRARYTLTSEDIADFVGMTSNIRTLTLGQLHTSLVRRWGYARVPSIARMRSKVDEAARSMSQGVVIL